MEIAMSKEKIQTIPNLSLTSPKHIEALKEAEESGEEYFRLWQRNVVDEFKPLSNEKIRDILKERAFPYAVCFENWDNNFNLSSGFRNANAFNAEAAYYVGPKKIDRRGMCGVHNYTDIHFISSIDKLVELKKTYTFIGFDNMPGATPLSRWKWQPNTLMIFGSEAAGLTPGMQELCDDMVFVEQFGSVRSLNAATASGIAMNSFCTQYRSL